MRNISESTAINASPDQLWGLLTDPDAIARLCPGVTGAELLPEVDPPYEGQVLPMHEGSRMAVKLLAASELVISRVAAFDPAGYAMRSEIVEGPHDLRGNLGARLDRIDETDSRLLIDGALDCHWLGKPALLGFLLGFKVGLPLLSHNIAELAKSKARSE